MRLAQIFVSAGRLEDTRKILDEESIDHVVLDDDRRDAEGALVVFPLPTSGVGPVLERLREVGVVDEESEGFEVITDATIASTPGFSELVQRYETEPSYSGLSREELHGKIRESSWSALTYYVGTLLSVVVATVGLFVDSPALVIGSMVIAPQVSTALSASVGVLSSDWWAFQEAVVRQVVGLTIAVVAAAVFAWLVRTVGIVPPTLDVTRLDLFGLRLAPTPLAVIAAGAAGAAGAFGVATDQSVALVGVMIAAALIPAAAAAGIGAAWGLPAVAVGALALLAANLLAINVASGITLGALGYLAPETSLASLIPENRTAVAVAGIVLLVLASGVVGAVVVEQAVVTDQVENSVQRTLTSAEYKGLALVHSRVAYAGPGGGDLSVSVTVERAADRPYPELASTLERRIEAATDEEATVRVYYLETAT